MTDQPMTLTERQRKHREKKKQDERECEQLKSDVRAATRIIDGVLEGLKTIAVGEANEKALSSAIAHIEAAMLLLSSKEQN